MFWTLDTIWKINSCKYLNVCWNAHQSSLWWFFRWEKHFNLTIVSIITPDDTLVQWSNNFAKNIPRYDIFEIDTKVSCHHDQKRLHFFKTVGQLTMRYPFICSCINCFSVLVISLNIWELRKEFRAKNIHISLVNRSKRVINYFNFIEQRYRNAQRSIFQNTEMKRFFR